MRSAAVQTACDCGNWLSAICPILNGIPLMASLPATPLLFEWCQGWRCHSYSSVPAELAFIANLLITYPLRSPEDTWGHLHGWDQPKIGFALDNNSPKCKRLELAAYLLEIRYLITHATDSKIPPVFGTNLIVGFQGYYPLTADALQWRKITAVFLLLLIFFFFFG